MRDHRFRGKHNGTWLYGDLVHRGGATYIFPADGLDSYDNYEVDPATVGEFIQLQDIKFKPIYEGDIVNLTADRDFLDSKRIRPVLQVGRGVVKWDHCAWMIETIFTDEDGNRDKRYLDFPEAFCHLKNEIIGNVWDTPSLLQGGEAK